MENLLAGVHHFINIYSQQVQQHIFAFWIHELELKPTRVQANLGRVCNPLVICVEMIAYIQFTVASDPV
jgi:hypothetical protein